MATPAKMPIRPEDLHFVMTFYDHDWNEVEHTRCEFADEKSVARMLAMWRQNVFYNLGEVIRPAYGLRSAVSCGIEVTYGN